MKISTLAPDPGHAPVTPHSKHLELADPTFKHALHMLPLSVFALFPASYTHALSPINQT